MHTCAITTPTNGGGPSCDTRGETLPITTTAPSIMPMASDFSNIGGDGGQEFLPCGEINVANGQQFMAADYDVIGCGAAVRLSPMQRGAGE